MEAKSGTKFHARSMALSLNTSSWAEMWMCGRGESWDCGGNGLDVVHPSFSSFSEKSRASDADPRENTLIGRSER